jgi:chorismate mutase-like protein
MDLSGWRQRIDILDKELLQRLNERMRCALEIGKIKKQHGQAIRDPEREEALLSKLKKYNEGPMRDETIEALFMRVIEEAIYLEEQEN